MERNPLLSWIVSSDSRSNTEPLLLFPRRKMWFCVEQVSFHIRWSWKSPGLVLRLARAYSSRIWSKRWGFFFQTAVPQVSHCHFKQVTVFLSTGIYYLFSEFQHIRWNMFWGGGFEPLKWHETSTETKSLHSSKGKEWHQYQKAPITDSGNKIPGSKTLICPCRSIISSLGVHQVSFIISLLLWVS